MLSEYDLLVGKGILGIKNMVSYYVNSSVTQYADLKWDGVKVSVPDVSNTIFRNGFYYSRYLGPQLFGRKLSGTIFFTDTRFTGSEIYMDSMQQVGFNFGLAPKRSKTGSFIRRALDTQDIRIGMTYIRAESARNSAKDIDGFSANFGFTF